MSQHNWILWSARRNTVVVMEEETELADFPFCSASIAIREAQAEQNTSEVSNLLSFKTTTRESD